MLLPLAYLDLGAGSILLQMILAGLLGLVYTIKLYWRRLIGLLRPEKQEKMPPTEIAATEDAPR